MDSIKIETGEKRVAINDDPARVIVFNPRDTLFMERFYRLQADIAAKLEEYQQLNADELDDDESPEGLEARFKLLREANEFVKEKIDYVFGDGTAVAAFGDVVSYDFKMYIQFIEGVSQFISPVRAEKVAKYTRTNTNGNGHKKAMPRKRKKSTS